MVSTFFVVEDAEAVYVLKSIVYTVQDTVCISINNVKKNDTGG